MALNIKDPATVRLAGEVAELASETKTRAVRTALEERRRRLRPAGGSGADRRQRLLDLLEREIWPQIPQGQLGEGVSKQQREAILGYGRQGV